MVKPSRELLEHLGDRVATELGGWFNTMDSSQKNELRELNEQNFARFDSRLEQRTGELHARIGTVAQELSARVDRLDAKIDTRSAELREVLERRLGEQSRWAYLTWAVQAAMIIGLYFK